MTQPTYQILAPALGKQCAGTIWNGPVYPARLCKRVASFHEDGEDWCVGHSKATKKARSDARFAKWKRGQVLREHNAQREVAEHAALAGIANPAAVPELVKVARAIRLFAKENPWTGLADSSNYGENLDKALKAALAALDKKGE